MSVVLAYLRRIFPDPLPAVDYAWDQWLYTDYFWEPDPDDFARLSGLSGLANRALAIALGEWAVRRLAQAPRAPEAQEFFDAAWITMIRRSSCEYIVLEHSAWSGPLDGALRAAMLIVNDTLFDAEEDLEFARRGCWSLNLARYITPTPLRTRLDEWIGGGLDRLEKFRPDGFSRQSLFDLHFSFGDPVDPDLFVIDRPYVHEGAIERFARHEAATAVQSRFYRPAQAGAAADDRL